MGAMPPMPPIDPASVVRGCEDCGQAAVVQVFAWQHSFHGMQTNETTRELRCQACGAWFKIHPKGKILGLWIMGGVMTLTTCLGGIPIFFLAWRRSQTEKRLPIIPGAPIPALRYPGGPPRRTCRGCKNALAASRVTRESTNGVPTGTEYEYQCATCNRRFVIESPLRHVFAVLGTMLMLSFCAAFLVWAESPGWRYGGSIVTMLIGLFLILQSGNRLLNRFRHPVVTAARS
jgi:DNA-directed RNA polymerase subunit RPC12/RpoP